MGDSDVICLLLCVPAVLAAMTWGKEM